MLEAVLRIVVVALASGTAGLMLGGILASSKVGRLYDRLDRAEAENLAREQLVRELTEALRLALDEPAPGHGADGKNHGRARQILQRATLAAGLGARIDDDAPARADGDGASG